MEGIINFSQAQAQQELMRRRAMGQPSSVAIPGGAPAANAISPANPIANGGQVPAQNSPMGGAAGFPSGDGVKQLKNQTGESTFIVKALAERLKALGQTGL